MSIHQDYLERSRMSATTGRLSTAGTTSDQSMTEPDTATSDHEYGAVDYGGGDDDDDDEDNHADFGFDHFIRNDANAERYSSISFQNDTFLEESQMSKTTTALLNALCSDMTQNDYQFFSQDTLDKLVGNSWAGAAHWKKSINLKKVDKKNANSTNGTTAATKATKKTKKKQSFVNFETDASSTSAAAAMAELLKPAPTNKRGGGNSRSNTDPTQLSKTMITKYGKTDHVLPLDAGMGLEQLSKLFLRPNAIVHAHNDNNNNQKTVAFQDQVDNWGDNDAGSFGDDDNDGPGFELHDDGDDDDDFVVTKLDDVRKVDKIHVGYATVAKKVDVKRLKKDLWTELECKMMPTNNDPNNDHENDTVVEAMSLQHQGPPVEKMLSFKTTVQEMEQQGQTQTDVTLPFYFICLLHLANEKGLELESHGLYDCFISQGGIV